ncbi:hypothetical protein V8C37DRAFT_364878 [Trichoderma ceciliae]
MKESTVGISHVGRIIDGECNEKKDWFTCNLVGAHKMAPRRYLSIRDIAPHGMITSSTDAKDIPEPGSGILFDTKGNLQHFYPQKKENRGKDIFVNCTFEYRPDSIMTLVQGDNDIISSSLSVLNIADKKNTAVLRMNGWKCSFQGTKLGNASDNQLQKVLDLIRDNERQRYWGFQWLRDSHAKNYGDVYGLSLLHDGDSLSHNASWQMFFIIDDKDWTYTSTIVKA